MIHGWDFCLPSRACLAKVGFIADTGHNIKVIQIESQIDEIVNVADIITFGFHNNNELFLIAQGKLVSQDGKVVELIKAFILAKHFPNAIDWAFIASDKPFLILLYVAPGIPRRGGIPVMCASTVQVAALAWGSSVEYKQTKL